MTPPAEGLVATVVAASGTAFSQSDLSELAKLVEAAHTAWLDDGRAADIFHAVPANEAYARLKKHIGARPFDVITQPVAHRRKKFLIADMESTVIEQELLDELAELIGVRDRVSDITRRAMNGELDFIAALKERVALLKNHPAKLLETAAGKITHSPGAEPLLATMKRNGAVCWLVSGGFGYFVQQVAGRLGFDASRANDLIVRDGIVIGEVSEPVLDKNAKAAHLREACAELGIGLADALAVGDGANDIPMLQACNEGGGLGVAYEAKPNVRAAVPHQINHTDLTTLLYAQGYRREEIISSSRT